MNKIRQILLILLFLFVFPNVFFRLTGAESPTAPNFAIHSLAGKRLVLYQLIDTLPAKGLVIINFTSIYCAPCKKEIPELKSITDKDKNEVMIMYIYSEDSSLSKKHAAEMHILENAYTDSFGSIRRQYNVQKIPVTLIINKEYKTIARFEGFTEKNTTAIADLIRNR